MKKIVHISLTGPYTDGFTYQEMVMLLSTTEKSIGGTIRRIKEKIAKLK